jgi:DNA-directed RNA polymerase subunit alpha
MSQATDTTFQDTEASPVADTAPVEPGFDLAAVENPSFAVLQAGRARVYDTAESLAAFRRVVEAMGASGEAGRRKGLGLWMLARYEEAAAQLSQYDKDDVAAFTRAKSLMSLGRPAEAKPLFERLSKAYPEEPRPRGGWYEAELETLLAAAPDAPEDAAAAVDKLIERAPPSFQASAEAHYLRGRVLEIRRSFEAALDEYAEAFEIDSTHRANLFRAARLAEACGLDELAVQFYEALVDQKPNDAAALMNLGVLYEDLGHEQDAAASYDTVLRSFPTDERARIYLEDARAGMRMYYDEDQERKEDRLNQILRIPITDFELSVRARNCLSKMEIQTLGDLVCRSEQELLSYKNFGETSLNEIKEILNSKGLRLGMSRDEAAASVEVASRRVGASPDKSDISNRPLSELALSIRARRAVETLGCLTIGDITRHSAEELLGMPNFGQTSLQELRTKLAEHNARLRGD